MNDYGVLGDLRPASAIRPNISSVSSDMEGDAHVERKSRLDTSPELIELARAGDKEAFGEIYRTFYPSIFRLARFHLGDGAEDAVSETFLRAWNGLPKYKTTSSPFSAWLYAIARHVVVDEVRRRVRTESREDLPERATEAIGVDRLALAAAIEELSQDHRRVIEMKYILGMRNPEVAAALGKTVGAVNAMQWRALSILRGLIAEVDE